jgi:hypothetical protein
MSTLQWAYDLRRLVAEPVAWLNTASDIHPVLVILIHSRIT